jgi:hypothetical protein
MGGYMANDDLMITRLKAHMNYVAPRIYSDKKRTEFVLAMLSFIDNEDLYCTDKHGGVKLAFDIYNEIREIHLKRFQTGRSEDFLIQKL